MVSIRIAVCALVALGSLAGLASDARAQAKKFEIGGMLGYQFGAIMDETTKEEQHDSAGNTISVDSLGEAIGLPPSAAFGLTLTYHLTRTMHIEAWFLQQPTELNFDDRAADTQAVLSDLRATYYMIGLMYNWSETVKQPFIGFMVGWTEWKASSPYESASGFTLAPVIGYKSWLSRTVGFRVHTSVLITNTPAGDMFKNTETGWEYDHTKNTWATQINISVALLLGR